MEEKKVKLTISDEFIEAKTRHEEREMEVENAIAVQSTGNRAWWSVSMASDILGMTGKEIREAVRSGRLTGKKTLKGLMVESRSVMDLLVEKRKAK